MTIDNRFAETLFKKGNSAWRARSSHGRKPIFETPKKLEEACIEYFEWIENNLEYVTELVIFQGQATPYQLPKRRNMSEDGLKVLLGISNKSWAIYKAKPDF